MKQTIKQLPKILCSLPTEIQEELEEVTPEQIEEFRESRKKLFVIKVEEKFYVLLDQNGRRTSERLAVKYSCGRHLCGRCANFCDSKGDLCLKVSVEEKKVEDFQFITKAVESIGFKEDCFIVADCKNFKLAKGNPDQFWGKAAQKGWKEFVAQEDKDNE